MFIPRGKVIHENLATSYVLVDALVEDLCEGGFSGIVAVVLQTSDFYIIIEHGKVAVAVERRDSQPPGRTTVSLIAARSRAERGRVSVYSYPSGTATVLAGRVTAEPLYTDLSTDFADLEKMLAKLSCERDRQWFIEVNTASEVAAFIHLDGEQRRLITDEGAEGDEEEALRRLLDECSRTGARFDVLFRRAALEETDDLLAAGELPPEVAAEPAEQEVAIEENIIAAGAENEHPPDLAIVAETDVGSEEEELYEQPDSSPPEMVEPDRHHDALIKGLSPNTMRLFAMPLMNAEHEEQESGRGTEAIKETNAPPSLNEDEAMIEIKRLMGEIARTIEEATKAAEPQSKFSMYLRTGQLKIADRFPFLDPFGAEFEYLGGEIAFIGRATPQEFIEGLTGALKLAVVGVAESSVQPVRLRNQIAQDLRRLQTRIGADLERFGLDESIAEIINYR